MKGSRGTRQRQKETDISGPETAWRKTVLEFGEADAALLRELHSGLEARRDALSVALYGYLEKGPQLLGQHAHDDAKGGRLKGTEAGYFTGITGGDYGPDYFDRRRHAALENLRNGVEPQWHIAAYRKYLAEVMSVVFDLLAGDRQKCLAACHALVKIAFLDLGLALDPYFEGRGKGDGTPDERWEGERWRDLYNNAPCGYHSLDADGLIVEINDTELSWLGYRRQQVAGKMRFQSLLTPDCKAAFDGHFEKLRTHGTMVDVEVELTTRDGGRFPALINATAVRDGEGRFVTARAVVYNMTERKKLERELIDHAGRISDLSHRLVQLKEEEMRRLASELHEQCSPNLAALKINFKMLAELLPDRPDGKVRQLLEDTSLLLAETTASVRQVCADLRPAVLDYAGLWKALESYAKNFSQRTGIAVHLAVDVGELKFTKNIETMLFRIAQEALTNCDKHAQASNVNITFARSGQAVVLTISDDGIGFDPAALGTDRRDTGIGLLTMRDRAEFVGGRFSLDTAPGRGTSIKVEISV